MWGAIIGAGISAAASLAGGAMQSSGASANNAAMMQFNAQEAQKNRDWQERMSNTAYQRAMADMRTAGLNPILAYQQGGASSPSGSSASVSSLENTMEGLGKGVSSAGQAYRNFQDLKLTNETIGKTASEADLNKANQQLSVTNALKAAQDTATSAATMRRADAETALTIEQMDNPKAYRALMGAQAHSARASGDLSDEQRKQLQLYGPHWTGQAAGSVGRVWDRFVRGGLSSPTDPRLYGLKGRPGDGPGLVIDIKK